MRWCIHVDTPRLKTGGCRSSSPNAPSNHDFACLVFGSDFRLTFSKQITDHVATIQCDSLCRNCWRRWAVRSWIFATRRRALPRLRLSRLARDRCFCAGRSFLSLARSNRGAAISPPSESIRKLGGWRTISKPAASSSRTGALVVGTSNSTTSITNQCPAALRLNLALFVMNSMACDCRILAQPTDGT